MHCSVVSAVASLSIVSMSAAGIASLQGVGITASGSYGSDAFKSVGWSIQFDFSGDMAGAASEADFGDWSFTLRNGASVWSVAGSGSQSGSWSTSGNARIFTIALAGSGAGNTLSPAPTSVSIIYTALRASGSWGSLGDALKASEQDPLRGAFVIRNEAGTGPGEITSGFAVVPAPGAVALLGLAGFSARRRRG
jgi:MYXO-CTERM domain-containing protein